MSNYTKSTDFASKDALLSGDPNKIVRGSEIDDEFNALQVAVNSKANTNSPTLTGTPLAPTATAGTNTTQIATTAFVKNAVDTATGSLGTLSSQDSDNVSITGGTVTATFTGDLTGNVTGDVTGNADTATAADNAIGVGQTWQSLTGSRSLGTTYTNSTGRSIQVTASVQNTASAVVGGVTIFNSYTVSCCGVPQISYFPISFIVPPGATYSISGSGLAVWAELR